MQGGIPAPPATPAFQAYHLMTAPAEKEEVLKMNPVEEPVPATLAKVGAAAGMAHVDKAQEPLAGTTASRGSAFAEYTAP